MATKTKEHDLMYNQAASLVVRDRQVQSALGIPLETSNMVKRSFPDSEQIHFAVRGVYQARGVAYAKKIDGEMKLTLVEVYIAAGQKIVVFNANQKRSWLKWNSPLQL